MDIPSYEFLVASSVVVISLSLLKADKFPPYIFSVFNIIAGILHGYAYGESIVGANTMPLFSYLTGFLLIQTVVGLMIMTWVSRLDEKIQLRVRNIGCSVCVLTGFAMMIL